MEKDETSPDLATKAKIDYQHSYLIGERVYMLHSIEQTDPELCEVRGPITLDGLGYGINHLLNDLPADDIKAVHIKISMNDLYMEAEVRLTKDAYSVCPSQDFQEDGVPRRLLQPYDVRLSIAGLRYMFTEFYET